MVGSKAIQASSADYSWNIFLALNEPYFFTKERAEKHIQRQLIATCIMNLEASTLKRSVKFISTIFWFYSTRNFGFQSQSKCHCE